MIIRICLFILLGFLISCQNNSNDVGESGKQLEWTQWYKERLDRDVEIQREMNSRIYEGMSDNEKAIVLLDAYQAMAKNWHDSQKPK